MTEPNLSRRDFVAGGSKLAFGAMIVPRHVLGGVGHKAPSGTLNIAIVGFGLQGRNNTADLLGENIVAICDVDLKGADERAEKETKDRDGNPRERWVNVYNAFKNAAKYTDYRRMLEERTDIDAVFITTPDHMHAHIAKTAMELGKHVYVQKPLTYTVREARLLKDIAARTGVVNQMGNQGHSSDDARLINEWVGAGVIGAVRDVHVYTNRPIWPQGLPRPSERDELEGDMTWNQTGLNNATAAAIGGKHKVPDDMDWDLYRGPAASEIAYHPMIHPFNWRGWVPFGVGALGDMGAHLIDHPYWALNLGFPTSIEATSTPWGGGNRNPATYPLAMTAHYEFPRRGLMPPVDLHWYDGGLMPKRPELLPDDVQLNREGGVIYIGERGILMHETYGRRPRIWPESLRAEAEAVPQTIARVEGGHVDNWIRACKGEEETVSPISYGADLTEVMLLGIVALRAGQGKKIYYDATAMRVTNDEDANQYLTREYRAGWEL